MLNAKLENRRPRKHKLCNCNLKRMIIIIIITVPFFRKGAENVFRWGPHFRPWAWIATLMRNCKYLQNRNGEISMRNYIIRYETSSPSRHCASIPWSKMRRWFHVTKKFQTKEKRFTCSIVFEIYLFEIRCYKLSSLKFPFVPVSSERGDGAAL